MINQFGVKGFNLVNSAFEFYEVTVNGEYKGTVKEATNCFGWMWFTNQQEGYGFDCEHSAIVALKEYLIQQQK